MLNFQLSPAIKQRQTLVMTPQLQLAIKLLQMSNTELADHLETMAEENPARGDDYVGNQDSLCDYWLR
jgi:RNA polymerase sigma-54 factor